VNDAPTLTSISTITGATEDTFKEILYSELAAAADESDVDNDPISFRIEAVTTGTLQKWSGSVWDAVFPGTKLLSGEKLQWKGAQDANGALNAFSVKAYDGNVPSASAVQVIIDVAAVNDAPTDIALSDISINENMVSGSTVGTLSSTDVDANSSFTYSLSGTDAASFSIVGNTLKTAAIFDFEAKNSYSITLTTTDQGSLSFSKDFTITINNLNEAPSSGNDSATTAEDTILILATTDFGSYTDPEGAPLASVKVKNRSGKGVLQFNSGSWSTVATDQVIAATDITAGKLRFSPDANEFGAAYALIDFTVSDGATESASTYTLTINVTAFNDPPTSTNSVVNGNEDNEVTLNASHFGNYFDVDGDPLDNVYISSLPDKGSLKLDGTDVTTPRSVSQADLLAGKLKYSPALNGNGSPYTSLTFQVHDGMSYSKESPYSLTINITPVNDAPTGAAVCDTLGSGNVFRTSVANGSTWQLTGCTGATDVDGDALTYKLTLAETGSSVSAGYTCDPSVSSSAGGTSVSGTFPNAASAYGSCRYTLTACDPSGQCSPASSNSVIISTYWISVGTPAKPSLSSMCVVTSGGTITASGNISNVVWSGNTGVPSATSITATGTSAGFTSNITSSLLNETFVPSAPIRTTVVSNLNATLGVTQATLAGAGANPPAAHVTSSTASSAAYYLVRNSEDLMPRAGGTGGAVNGFLDLHSDGLQASYATTASTCRACSTAPIASISSGGGHTCVVESWGSTKCWGDNLDYQIGDGSRAPQQMPTSPQQAAWAVHWQIAAGSNFTCALGDSTTSQGVKCWGSNTSFQTGQFSYEPIQSPSAAVSGMNAPPINIALSKTGEHACAITVTGNVWCWGNNTNGQLGNNETLSSFTARQVQVSDSPAAYLPSVRSIAAGGSHSCAALSYDASYAEGIYCWGLNDSGQLGDSSTTQRAMATAVDISNIGSTSNSVWFTQIVAGDKHTCALRNDGAVFCWGLNSSGQLGDGSTTQRNLPTAHATLGTASGVVALTAGANHTCALKSNHEVLCWGENGNGQLGNGTTTSTLSNPPVTTLAAPGLFSAGAVAISAGASRTCAAFFDGTIQCWGGSPSSTPALQNWSAGTTANANFRPQLCHKYSIP
jgi:alpha-tubulin suppressor-like RCC1 family protein